MPDLIPVVQLGASGVLLLVLYYLIRIIAKGDIIPRSTVDTLINAKNEEIVRANFRADEWHKAYEGERHVSELVRDQNRELIEVARTVEHVMESLGELAEGRRTKDVAPQ